MLSHSDHTDISLFFQFKAGDKKAFALIYKQFYERIYHFARKYVAAKENAEDITADTFIKLWKRREAFESMENIVAFLHVTARNACLDFLKHIEVKTEKHKELLHLSPESVEMEFKTEEIKSELMKLIYAEVDKLPAKMKEIFLLSYKEGLKPAEIAGRLKLSVQTVSNQKTNAVKLLQSVISNPTSALLFVVFLEVEWTSYPGYYS